MARKILNRKPFITCRELQSAAFYRATKTTLICSLFLLNCAHFWLDCTIMDYSDSFRIGPNRRYSGHADESYYLDPPRLTPERTYYYVKKDGRITRLTSERRTDDEDLRIPELLDEAYTTHRGRSQALFRIIDHIRH
jgi:hypothetical protein